MEQTDSKEKLVYELRKMKVLKKFIVFGVIMLLLAETSMLPGRRLFAAS